MCKQYEKHCLKSRVYSKKSKNSSAFRAEKWFEMQIKAVWRMPQPHDSPFQPPRPLYNEALRPKHSGVRRR